MAGDVGEHEWRQILELAQAAADLAQAERRPFVESACSDLGIIERVLELAEEFSTQPEYPKFEIGSQIGRFTLTGRIGRGGMGQVFSARDPELERIVALKVLLPGDDGTAGSSKVIREARAASPLNHPNIVTIHEVLKIGAAVAIVMEFVPGDSLRDWIGKPHDITESLAIMSQMASGVEAAHAAHIIHRDLKPENVIVRPDKRVKILDFGLARTVNAERRATLSASMGNFAGTFRYMAPEQWSGVPPAAASDIFSLGIIFYETLTGKHPFDASSLPESMRAVIERVPQRPAALRPEIPSLLDELVMKMLSKAPLDRPSAHEVVTSLGELDKNLAAPNHRMVRRQGRVRWILWGALGVLALSSFVAWKMDVSDFLSDGPRMAENFTIVPLVNELGFSNSPTFSPDARDIAYSWNGRKRDNFDIYVKVVGAQDSIRLTSAPEMDYSPVWSPDGKSIVFCRGSENGNAAIWIMSSLGGSERKLYDLHWRADYANRHLSWSPDGKHIVFPDRSEDGTNALLALELSTGATRQITFPTGSQIDLQPAHSPDGKFLAFVRDWGGGVNRIHLLPLTEGSVPFSLDWEGFEDMNAGRPVWTPDSRYLLVISNRGGDSRLWIGPAKRSGTTRVLSSLGNNLYDSAISSNGKLALVYQHYDSDIYKLNLERLRQGSPVIPEPVANSTRLELNSKVSPDGRKIAFESNRSGYMEVWTANSDGSNPTPLTEMRYPVTGSPAWSHDGRRIVFDSRSGGSPRLFVIDALGGRPQPLTREEDNAVIPAWSADDSLVYFSSDRNKTAQIWGTPAAGGRPAQITQNGGFAVIPSPDGKTIYYAANRARVTELRAMDLATRKETTVAQDVLRRNYTAGQDGVYYVSGQFLGPYDLKLLQPSRPPIQIYRFEKPLSEGLDVSLDGTTLFFSQMEQDGTELMLVEDFWR